MKSINASLHDQGGSRVLGAVLPLVRCRLGRLAPAGAAGPVPWRRSVCMPQVCSVPAPGGGQGPGGSTTMNDTHGLNSGPGVANAQVVLGAVNHDQAH